jgi:hypothetical protein
MAAGVANPSAPFIYDRIGSSIRASLPDLTGVCSSHAHRHSHRHSCWPDGDLLYRNRCASDASVFTYARSGLIWLAIAVVLWPLISGMLQACEKVFIDRLIHRQPVGLFPFSLVESRQITIGSLMLFGAYAQQLVRVVLLLVAVLYLSRMRMDRNREEPRTIPIES